MSQHVYRSLVLQAEESHTVSVIYDRARQCQEALVAGRFSSHQARQYLTRLADYSDERLGLFLEHPGDPTDHDYDEGIRNLLVGLSSWSRHLYQLAAAAEERLVELFEELLRTSLIWEKRLSRGTQLLQIASQR